VGSVTVRAVVLPATPLLVPGAAGEVRPLAATRRAVLDALAGVRGAGPGPARWGVLAPGVVTRCGARRASLGGVGIADRWVPSLPTRAPGPVAGTAASVALWALGVVAGDDAVLESVVVELGPGAPVGPDVVDEAHELLAGLDGLVIAGGVPGDPGAGAAGLAPALAAVVDTLAGRGGWHRTVTRTVETGEHLPPEYDVVVWSDDQSSANHPTPASSSTNRMVRPTSSTGT
jgi:hypothetical protein